MRDFLQYISKKSGRWTILEETLQQYPLIAQEAAEAWKSNQCSQHANSGQRDSQTLRPVHSSAKGLTSSNPLPCLVKGSLQQQLSFRPLSSSATSATLNPSHGDTSGPHESYVDMILD
jgi:hypothetical protein